MASINNWLGFSLSPQELPSSEDDHHHHHHLQDRSQRTVVSSHGVFNSDEVSATDDVSGECFDLASSDPTAPPAPPLNCLPATPFGVLEAFNRNDTHCHQDWNMKGIGMSTDLSMLMGSSCNSQQPKLENFLGGHPFSDQEQHKLHSYGDYMISTNCSRPLPSNDHASINTGIDNNNSNSNNNYSIGLSMIKSWLRNQPAPQSQPLEAKSNGGAQSLSLSMGTGGGGGGDGGDGGGGGGGGDNNNNGSRESSSLDDNNNNNNIKPQQAAAATTTTTPTGCLDSQSGASEAVPRKSIDTFGQRTSIYRGVTRHRWTGRYEAHLWDNSCRREGQTRKGRQVAQIEKEEIGGGGGEDEEFYEHIEAPKFGDLAAPIATGPKTTTITGSASELVCSLLATLLLH